MVGLIVALGATAQAVNIEWVTVGDAGNAADTKVMDIDGTTGYGAVGYEYRIGKYEITAGQYCEFLNAVAGTDPQYVPFRARKNVVLSSPILYGTISH